MTKYLICESKARAMGISRETYIDFVESRGISYNTSEQPIDAYDIICHPTDDRCLLAVDDSTQYYGNLPDIHKSRLTTREAVILEGWSV